MRGHGSMESSSLVVTRFKQHYKPVIGGNEAERGEYTSTLLTWWLKICAKYWKVANLTFGKILLQSHKYSIRVNLMNRNWEKHYKV